MVDDGDIVESGDILIRFDDEFLQSDLTVITEQLFEIMARKARLVAERDDAEVVKFDRVLLDANNNPVVAELIAGQKTCFWRIEIHWHGKKLS